MRGGAELRWALDHTHDLLVTLLSRCHLSIATIARMRAVQGCGVQRLTWTGCTATGLGGVRRLPVSCSRAACGCADVPSCRVARRVSPTAQDRRSPNPKRANKAKPAKAIDIYRDVRCALTRAVLCVTLTTVMRLTMTTLFLH